MKPLLITFFIVFTSCCYGQMQFVMADKLNDFIKNTCINDNELFWINNIINHRDTSYLKQKIDTSHLNKIKITEVWDKSSSNYGIKEEYASDSEVDLIYKNAKIDTNYLTYKRIIHYQFTNLDTIKNSVVLFGPNAIEANCGCGQVAAKIRRQCYRRAEMKAKHDGATAETFARLITYINKSKGQISFVLEIPISAKRQVYYGLSGTDNNKHWFD